MPKIIHHFSEVIATVANRNCKPWWQIHIPEHLLYGHNFSVFLFHAADLIAVLHGKADIFFKFLEIDGHLVNVIHLEVKLELFT